MRIYTKQLIALRRLGERRRTQVFMIICRSKDDIVRNLFHISVPLEAALEVIHTIRVTYGITKLIWAVTCERLLVKEC